MNPEYVIVGGIPWRLMGKRIGLWYAHKSTDMKLQIATALAHKIFTSSPEGFRLRSPKISVVGQGIDPVFFQPHLPHRDMLHLITVGRISEIKRIKEMIAAMGELYAQGKRFVFTIVGSPVTSRDKEYLSDLQRSIAQEPYRTFIQWRGALSHKDLPGLLAQSDIFLNLSATGSMDKAVLEALASGLIVISNNEAFRSILEPQGLFLYSTDPKVLADVILETAKRNIPPLAPMIAEQHSLRRLIPKILRTLQT